MLCCGYTLTDFPISIRLTSLALRQSNDCPSASKATLMNMDKYFMWNHYERLHNHNKAKHNKTVCIFIGIYCMGPMSCREQSTAVRRLPRETTLAVVTSYTTSTSLRSMLSVNKGFPMWKSDKWFGLFDRNLSFWRHHLKRCWYHSIFPDITNRFSSNSSFLSRMEKFSCFTR